MARGRIDFLSYRMLDNVDGDPRTPQATRREGDLEMFVPWETLPGASPRWKTTSPSRWKRPLAAGKKLIITGTLPRAPAGKPVSIDVSLHQPASPPALVLAKPK
ncbi:MAG: hypothetical protein U0797_09455 [Gemmataceae bacterium]